MLLCLPPRDYHKKQNALRALQKKALDKNPDEFYFKMIRTQLKVRNQIALKQDDTATPSHTFLKLVHLFNLRTSK